MKMNKKQAEQKGYLFNIEDKVRITFEDNEFGGRQGIVISIMPGETYGVRFNCGTCRAYFGNELTLIDMND
jgi:hypothetical protein